MSVNGRFDICSRDRCPSQIGVISHSHGRTLVLPLTIISFIHLSHSLSLFISFSNHPYNHDTVPLMTCSDKNRYFTLALCRVLFCFFFLLDVLPHISFYYFSVLFFVPIISKNVDMRSEYKNSVFNKYFFYLFVIFFKPLSFRKLNFKNNLNCIFKFCQCK